LPSAKETCKYSAMHASFPTSSTNKTNGHNLHVSQLTKYTISTSFQYYVKKRTNETRHSENLN